MNNTSNQKHNNFINKYCKSKDLFFIFALCVTIFLPSYYTLGTVQTFSILPSSLNDDDWTKALISRHTSPHIIQYIHKYTPTDSIFLVFRPSGFAYYAKRKFISYLDPRLVSLYTTSDTILAYNLLQQLKIDYIYVPYYLPPAFYNSQIFRIAGNPRFANLEFEHNDYRLYKINRKLEKIQLTSLELRNSDFSEKNKNGTGPAYWQIYSSVKKYNARNWEISVDKQGESFVLIWNENRFLNRGNKTYLFSGRGTLNIPPSNTFESAPLIPSHPYRLTASVKGKGLLKVWLVEYSLSVPEGRWKKIWESHLVDDHYTLIENQFLTMSDAQEYRIVFSLEGVGNLYINKVDFQKIDSVGIPNKMYLQRPEDWRGGAMFLSSLDSLSWGYTTDSNTGNYGLFIRQHASRDYFLKSTGGVPIPRGVSLIQINAAVKGKSYISLILTCLSYDVDGENKIITKQETGPILLMQEYNQLDRHIKLPYGTHEILLEFRLSKKLGKLATLYVDDIVIKGLKEEVWLPIISYDFENPKITNLSESKAAWRSRSSLRDTLYDLLLYNF